MSNHIDPKMKEIIDRHDQEQAELDARECGTFVRQEHQDRAYLLSEYKRLQEANEGMKEALEWYADEEKYTRSEEDYMIGYPPEIRFDQGRKAREALSHLKGE